MIAGEAEAAPAAAPPSPDGSDAEEEVEESTGLYLAGGTTAALCIKDAALAAQAAWYARACQLKKASEVARRLRRLPDDYWAANDQAQRFRDTYRVSVGDGGDTLANVERSIANELEAWPLDLAVAAARLDAVLELERREREQVGVSQMDKVTSLLTSASVLEVAPEVLRRRGDGSRVDLLEGEVREAGVAFRGHTLDCVESALKARLAREDEGVRAAAAWRRAAVQLPRNDTAANAQLANAASHASLGHPETRAPQNAEDVAVFAPWDDETEHQEALDEWNAWTLEEPSDLATVGRTTRRGHDGTDRGLPFDYRVPADSFVVPTADSYPRRSSGAPTVVQPASALPPIALLHDLVDGLVLGEKATAGRAAARSEASS